MVDTNRKNMLLFDFHKNQFSQTDNLSDKPFIVGSDIILSEKEAHEIHQTLKSLLLELHIPSGHPVCIYGEKEAMFPVVMITLMSLNIPYIPIDAIMPVGRIKNIQEQTQSKVLINCSSKKCEINFDIHISNNLKVEHQTSNSDYFLLQNNQDPIRYILFTSGSTGTPKGVQITASALNSFVEWYLTWPGINHETIFMNQAPFSFDISLCDFIGTFANGSTLVLNDYSVLKNGNVFLNRLKQFDANTIVCTPSFIKMYVSIPDFNFKNYPHLKQCIFIGEELPASTVKKLKQLFPDLKVINAYGPTEATIVVTYIEITEAILKEHNNSLPIGYCMPKSEVVVLNTDAETGVGELGLVGQNLSIGYFKDEAKTQLAFVTENGKRTYKTGDVGYIKDGLIFYLGRNDSQVKLNGYRIELEEISNKLLTHPLVSNASVIPLTSGRTTKKIIAYVSVTPELESQDYNHLLKTFLSADLPSYMIPSEFVALSEFPLNSNYKTDKKALLALYMDRN